MTQRAVQWLSYVVAATLLSAQVRGDEGSCVVGKLRRSQVSIEALEVRKLDQMQLPARLVEDEKGLVAKDIDLPIVLIRCRDKPGAVWTLRLPEFNILGTKGLAGYQTKYRWRQHGPNDFSYDWHPITGSMMKGKVRARVFVDKQSRVRFEIIHKNESSDEWIMPAVWVCLIHRYSGAGRDFYWSADGLKATSIVPDPKDIWLKWLAVKGQEGFADACRRWVGYKIRPGIAEKPQLVWKSDEPRGFQVRIGSEQAGLVGWSKWPCTDLGVRGQNLKPGQRQSYRGYVEMGFAQPPDE